MHPASQTIFAIGSSVIGYRFGGGMGGHPQTNTRAVLHVTRVVASRFIRLTRDIDIEILSLCVGAKYRCGIKILRLSTDNSLYLANDTTTR